MSPPAAESEAAMKARRLSAAVMSASLLQVFISSAARWIAARILG